MKISKRLNMAFSHKFPNGDIVSITFGTDHSIDSILEDAPEEEIAKLDKEISKRVYIATKKDIKRVTKQDELVTEIMRGIQDAVKSQKDERAAEKALEDEDA